MPKKLLLLPPLSASSAFRAPRARPAARPAMNAARTGYRVFSANSTAACTELAKRITERLGAELGKSAVYQETNGETRVEIKESVRGQDIFIIQTIPRDVNTAVMELLIMAYALKTACARNIIGVILYFPLQQAKQDEEEGLHCVQAPGVDAGESWFNSHYQYGSSSKGNTRLFQLSRGQP